MLEEDDSLSLGFEEAIDDKIAIGCFVEEFDQFVQAIDIIETFILEVELSQIEIAIPALLADTLSHI